MRVIVLMKEVPDTYGERAVDLETGLLKRADAEPVLDEITERALEVALRHREAQPGTEVVLLSVGPEGSLPTTLRKGLAMGADRAVHVQDPALLGADLTLTAQVIAAAAKQIGFDLVIAGNVSTDGGGGISITEALPEARFPNFKGIMAALGGQRGGAGPGPRRTGRAPGRGTGGTGRDARAGRRLRSRRYRGHRAAG